MKVNTTNSPDFPVSGEGWRSAVFLAAEYVSRPGRADALLASERSGLSPREYARAEDLFYAVLRNFSLLRAAVDRLCAKPPMPEARALLLVAGVELLRAGDNLEKRAKATDYAVGMADRMLPRGMKGFVNAVLRRLPESLDRVMASAGDEREALALKFSHPGWLVTHWCEELGVETTKKLLEWDQTPAPVFVRLEALVAAPDCLSLSAFPGYFTYAGGGWEKVEALLSSGRAYAQDPSTGISVELLNPKPGAAVLDLCAAPGGKARQLLSRVGPEGRVVCVDLPERTRRLAENLQGIANAAILESDVFLLSSEIFAAQSLPAQYEAVLLDAPCSNTGVLRRRVDARWRLTADDIAKCARLQFGLLKKAATFVAPGGSLVYSTCSIEKAENAEIAEAFLKAVPGFEKVAEKQVFPWADGIDGAGAALFRRIG